MTLRISCSNTSSFTLDEVVSEHCHCEQPSGKYRVDATPPRQREGDRTGGRN